MKKPSPWLASEDILGKGDIAAVIGKVYYNTDVPMEGGRREKELYSVSFVGETKELILNAGNKKLLMAAYGPLAKGWRGKPVVLYVQGGVRKPGTTTGETCNGIRIRIPAGVDGATGEITETPAAAPTPTPAPAPAPEPDSPALASAKRHMFAVLKEYSMSQDDLKAHLKKAYSTETTKTLTLEQVGLIVKWIKANGKLTAAASESPLG